MGTPSPPQARPQGWGGVAREPSPVSREQLACQLSHHPDRQLRAPRGKGSSGRPQGGQEPPGRRTQTWAGTLRAASSLLTSAHKSSRWGSSGLGRQPTSSRADTAGLADRVIRRTRIMRNAFILNPGTKQVLAKQHTKWGPGACPTPPPSTSEHAPAPLEAPRLDQGELGALEDGAPGPSPPPHFLT